MKNASLLLLICALCLGCAAGKKSTSASADKQSYGYSEKNPVNVGGGPSGERAYLDRLTGPGGEKVTYVRQGSCCPFKTKNGILDNTGMLDKYEVKYNGIAKPVILYLNMYDKGDLFAPEGFVLKD